MPLVNCRHCGVPVKSRAVTRLRKYCSQHCAKSAQRDNRGLADRFWPNVEKTATCWLWRGPKLRTGYGVFRRSDGSRCTATHIAWELDGRESVVDRFLCHVCDNPACVRPDHLFIGFHLENQRDAFQKGRHAVQRYRASHPFCPNGHAFTPENTGYQMSAGYKSRYCRSCMRAKVAKSRHRATGTATLPESK